MNRNHETILLEILAAMLPKGKDRSAILRRIQATSDDFDNDGDLYRISSDDEELAHWRDVIWDALQS